MQQRLSKDIQVASGGYNVTYDAVYQGKDKLIAVINVDRPKEVGMVYSAVFVKHSAEALVEVKGDKTLPVEYLVAGKDAYDCDFHVIKSLPAAEIQKLTQDLPRLNFTPIEPGSDNHIKTHDIPPMNSYSPTFFSSSTMRNAGVAIGAAAIALTAIYRFT